MAIELAAAYVTIIPSMKGAKRQITAALSGVDTTSVGSKIGEELSGGLGQGLNLISVGQKFKDVGANIAGVGSALTEKITKPALVAGGAIAGVVGALGFKRLVGLDTAKGQFRGLGYDVEKVMAQVDKGVQDTALTMADGAALAVGALATGNLPLNQLENQLKRVANVSAAYGVESSHAGYLLNNVLTKNKVTWGDLAQMQENQIPIISQLANHYGVTGDELQKMVQEGKVSIEDFNKVLDQNAGKAAEEYAKTWPGIVANIKANIGKIGENLLGPMFNSMKGEMGDFLNWLKSDNLKSWAADFGKTIGSAFQKMIDFIKAAIEWWNSLPGPVQKGIGVIAGVAVAAGPALVAAGNLIGSIGGIVSGLGGLTGAAGGAGAIGKIGALFAGISGPAGIAIGVIALVGAALAGLVASSTELQSALGDAFKQLIEVGKQLWEALHH